MKMQIKKLFLVQRGTYEIKEYDFEPGKLNIVMGQGARGKTTIWSIIDYVCCSQESDIDSKISKVVEWVGIEMVTSLGTYVIARELKDDLVSKSPNYFMKHLEANCYEIDNLEIATNSNAGAVKGLLDRICGVEAMTTLADENGQKISFSIRYLLNIIGQDYRTVADQLHLFAFKAPQQWQTIAKYFPSIIGVDADKLNLIRAEKQQTEKALKKFKEEYKRALVVSEEWKRDLQDQLMEAKKLTMVPSDVEIPKEVEKALALVRAIIDEARRKPMLSYNVELLGDLANKVAKNQEKKAGLELEIEQIQVRIEELEELEKKATAIHSEAVKAKDRMEIARWMMENWGEYHPTMSFARYPYSDGRIAEEVRAEIEKLNEVLCRYEKTALSSDKVLQFKNLNAAEKKRLKARQEQISQCIQELRDEIIALQNKGVSEKERLDAFRSVNQRASELIGKFQKTIELVEGLSDTGALARQIESMQLKIDSIKAQIEIEKAQVDVILNEKLRDVADRTFAVAKGVGLDESFKFANLEFDSDKLDFKVLYGDSASYLKSRKSTANHVAFHIGITAALQEMCVGDDKALLPDFVVYDQPTQGRSGVRSGINIGEECFINIAKELAMSTKKSKEPWQPILIDSWNRETLSKLDGVEYHLVADLDESSGLVPSDWMNA